LPLRWTSALQLFGVRTAVCSTGTTGLSSPHCHCYCRLTVMLPRYSVPARRASTSADAAAIRARCGQGRQLDKPGCARHHGAQLQASASQMIGIGYKVCPGAVLRIEELLCLTVLCKIRCECRQRANSAQGCGKHENLSSFSLFRCYVIMSIQPLIIPYQILQYTNENRQWVAQFILSWLV
jgi:hypothetical protein